MKIQNIVLSVILTFSITVFLPVVHAESPVSIIMEKTTYTYCEKLFYIIEVSEITGDPAIIHIRDETGKGSSAIPILITDLKNPIPSLVPFEENIFPLGKYFIDVQYADKKVTAEFDLVDSDKLCMPELIKPILANWLSENISDGFLMDAFQKYIDKELINIPFEINENNVYDIEIPDWVRNVGNWWIQGIISDDDFADAINYLIDKRIISFPIEVGNEI